MRPLTDITTYVKSFHPATRMLVIVCSTLIILGAGSVIILTMRHCALVAIYVLIGATPPSDFKPLRASVALAVIGYALAPAVIALVVASAFQRRIDSHLLDTSEALARVANLLKDIQTADPAFIETNNHNVSSSD